MQNLHDCNKLHAQNGAELNEADHYNMTDAKNFLRVVSNLSISNQFPDKKLLLTLLELILVI